MSASGELDRLELRDRLAELLALLARRRRRGRRRPGRGRRPSRRPRSARRRGSRGTVRSPCRARRAGFPPGTAQSLERQLARVRGPPAELVHRCARSRSRGVPFGTIRFEISSSPVRAVIVTQAVMSVPALVMKIFEPLTIHSPSRSSAGRARGRRVRARAGLGQPEGRELPARGEVGQPLPLLLLGPEVVGSASSRARCAPPS